MRWLRTFIVIGIFGSSFFASAAAQNNEELQEGVVQEIITEEENANGVTQELELLITRGSDRGEIIILENADLPLAAPRHYAVGDRLLIATDTFADGSTQYFIVDYIRRGAIGWLFLFFIILVALIARRRGIAALVGMVFSFAVIFWFLLPRLLWGANPVIFTLLALLLILPASFLLAHGWNRKTLMAMLASFLTLAAIGLLATFVLSAAHLTGSVSDAAAFLQFARGGSLHLSGILLAGILIAVLGILDDITISQAAIVQELKAANAKLSPPELFWRAMNVGRDHIASLVNTLILVYAGASLPLLLLFLDERREFLQVLNFETVAEEIVATLLGSIGLVLAVPIATALAVFLPGKDKPATAAHFHSH